MGTVYADVTVGRNPYVTDVVLYVRKFITIITMTLLMPGSGIAELQHLGLVVEHYQHHVVDHGETSLSFFEFLVDHFAAPTHHDAHHSQLPFHDCQTSHAPVVYVAWTEHIVSEPPSILLAGIDVASEGRPLHHSGFVFQPPRS